MNQLNSSAVSWVCQRARALTDLRRCEGYARLSRRVLMSMGVLMAQVTVADPIGQNEGTALKTTTKTLFVVLDGIPADVIERVNTPGIDAVAANGSYQRAYVGGELNRPTESPTVSAVGYMSLLTGTWSNKHNVRANYDLAPNYAFWDIFRVAKHQANTVTTGLFSTWTDNRTILMGDGRPEAGGYKFDFVADGFEKDPAFAPELDDIERIQAIDRHVTTLAAKTIGEIAPDLSWVYLQHTDDIGHRDGDGPAMDLAVRWVDARVSELWSTVETRAQRYKNEHWLVVITTDHGRTLSDGKGHGGQSDRERTIWIASNSPRMVSPRERAAAIVDIYPSIVEHMRFQLPDEVAAQLEGQSLLSE